MNAVMKRAFDILLVIALLSVSLACASDYDGPDPMDDHPQVLRAEERQRNEDNRSEYRRRD